MTPNKGSSRIDTLDLKELIFRKIGHHRTEKYFDQLTGLLNFKITKREFDRLCIQTIGRDNMPLHNRLILSILKNACVANVPPPLRSTRKVSNGYQKKCLESVYGDSFLPSPRKGRSRIIRDRKFLQDRPSPLGPLGKSQKFSLQEFNSKSLEQQCTMELTSLGSQPPVEVASVEEGEEVEQESRSPGIQSRIPVTAPFGISMNFGRACSILSNLVVCNYHSDICRNRGELPDTRSLRGHLERKLEMDSVRISADCVNLLNNGLDVYLKRLIEPCMNLAGSNCVNEQLRPFTGHRFMQRAKQSTHVSLSDFQVAMHLSPQILGKDWVVHLEKIGLLAEEGRS